MEEKVWRVGTSELRQLEEENARLKKLIADLSLDKHMLQEVLKKAIRPARRRELAWWLIEQYQISEHRVARVTMLVRSTFRYQPVERVDGPFGPSFAK